MLPSPHEGDTLAGMGALDRFFRQKMQASPPVPTILAARRLYNTQQRCCINLAYEDDHFFFERCTLTQHLLPAPSTFLVDLRLQHGRACVAHHLSLP